MLKSYFSQKSIGFYILIVAIVSAFICLIFYATGSNDLYGSDVRITILLTTATIAGLIFSYKDFFGFGSILISILACITMGIFLSSRYVYFSNLYFNISPEPVNKSITVVTIFLILMIITGIVSAFFRQEKEE